jgi:hypothetical protein
MRSNRKVGNGRDSTRKTRTLLLLAGMSAILAFAVPATALASPAARPSATISFAQSKVTAGAQPQFSYSARHLPRGSKVYLQRLGPRNTWRTVERLRGTTGSASAPADRAGLRWYRIRVVHHHARLAVSAPRPLSVVAPSSGGSTILGALKAAGSWLVGISSLIAVLAG